MEVVCRFYDQYLLLHRVDSKVRKNVGVKHLATHGVQDDVDTTDFDPDRVAQGDNALTKALDGIAHGALDHNICIEWFT